MGQSEDKHTKLYRFHGQSYRLEYLDLNTVPPIDGPFNLDAAVRRIAALNSPEDIFSVVSHAARSLGFDSVSYGCMFKATELAPLLVVSTPLARPLWEAAHASGLLAFDETIVHVARRRIPGVWHLSNSDLSRRSPMMAEQWKSFCASRVFFPLHGPMEEIGIMAFNSVKPDIGQVVGDSLTNVLQLGHFLSVHAHDQMCQTGFWGQVVRNDSNYAPLFTNKERDVLLMLSKGNTTKEVASLLDIEEVTVNYHIKKLKGKLDAETIGELIAKAVDLGVIKPRALDSSVVSLNLSPYVC